MSFISRLRYYLIKLFSSEIYYYKNNMLVYLTPTTTNIFFNTGEKKLYEYIKKYGDLNKSFIDVGACVGMVGIPASNYFKEVHFFEPNPSNKSILDLNINANNVHNYKSHSFSLGDSQKEVLFTDSYGTSKKSDKTYGIKVTQRTGDSFGFINVGFIKIDVEGFEFEVLKGFSNTIKAYRPVIVLESNTGNNDKVHPLMKLLGYNLVEHFQENELWVARK